MLIRLLKYFLTITISAILLTVVVDALEAPDGLSLRFWEKGAASICPEGMVLVVGLDKDFCIDKYEASPGDECGNLAVLNPQQTIENLDDRECRPVSAAGRAPWVFVNKAQAQALCARAGKRLPTAAEWYYAALGTPDLNRDWTAQDCQVDHNWSEQPGLTGQAENCVSGAGVYDMVGNVWEWMLEQADNGEIEGFSLPSAGYVAGLDANGIPQKTTEEPTAAFENDYLWIKRNGQRLIARGGYYDNQDRAGVNAWYAVSESNFAGVGVGFRCVR